jgi:hypothetical protein
LLSRSRIILVEPGQLRDAAPASVQTPTASEGFKSVTNYNSFLRYLPVLIYILQSFKFRRKDSLNPLVRFLKLACYTVGHATEPLELYQNFKLEPEPHKNDEFQLVHYNDYNYIY